MQYEYNAKPLRKYKYRRFIYTISPASQEQLSAAFSKMRRITEDHITPSRKTQNFLFCSFKKKAV